MNRSTRVGARPGRRLRPPEQSARKGHDRPPREINLESEDPFIPTVGGTSTEVQAILTGPVRTAGRRSPRRLLFKRHLPVAEVTEAASHCFRVTRPCAESGKTGFNMLAIASSAPRCHSDTEWRESSTGEPKSLHGAPLHGAPLCADVRRRTLPRGGPGPIALPSVHTATRPLPKVGIFHLAHSALTCHVSLRIQSCHGSRASRLSKLSKL